MRTATKQDLIPGLNRLDYAIWGVLENKTNATSHWNIGSLKTTVEEEWNRMSEEFISKTYKSFRKRVDKIIGKKLRLYCVNLLFCAYPILLFIFLNQNYSSFIIESFIIILEYSYFYFHTGPLSWGYRIKWLHLCRGVILP